MNHIYQGHCPDDLQPDARDPKCPACSPKGHPGLPNIMAAQSPVLKDAVLLYGAECYKRGYRQGLEDAAHVCETHPDGQNMLGGDFVACAKAIREMKP